MMRRILIGLDGSEFSASATALGIQWARHFSAQLIGLGIIDQPTILRAEPIPIGGSAYKHHRDDTLLVDARFRVEQFLEKFGDDCRHASVARQVLEDIGQPYQQIVFEAQRCDVVLLGQETYFHFETQRRACETLERVLTRSPRPVVTVPRELKGGSSILVAYDGSLQAARALQLLQALGLHRLQPIHVVCVGQDKEDAGRRAAQAVAFLAAHEVKAGMQIDVANKSATAELLLRWARELDASLIVMGAYGQPVLKEFMLGSVTQALLRDASIPLFLYH